MTRDAVEAWHRLRVVIEDVWRGVDDRRQRAGVALEIRYQHLDAAARSVAAHGAHRGGPVRGAAIREIITIHRCDHDVLELEIAHGSADALGLLAVLPRGTTMRNGAIAAVARADVAQDHEGRGRVLPALADVGAVRLLTDRVQARVAHQPLQSKIVRAAGGAHLEPRRLPFANLDDGQLH